MNSTKKYLFSLLRSAIYKEKPLILTENEAKKIDWDNLYQEALAGKVACILYATVKTLPKEKQPSEELLDKWQKMAFMAGTRQLTTQMQLAELLKIAKQKDIVVIPFKGIILADLYHEYLMRSSCDIDILIYPKDKEEVEDILKSLAFIKNEKHSKENVPVYVHPNGCMIELHLRLWEDYQGKRVSMLEEMRLTEQDTLIQLRVCDMDITTLGYEEHLIYQIYHIIKHFSFKGMDIRHFTDTVLYINKYMKEIDFDDFWKKMEKLGYDKFCRQMFRIGIKYFDLNPNVLPSIEEKEEDEEKILDELFAAGMLGLKNYETAVASAIVYQTYYENDTAPSKWKMFKASFFPNASDLSDKYMYARKNKLFLPIAWFHRAYNHCIARILKKEEKGISGHLEMAQQKFKVLKSLDLINKD